jgi:CheY-like chemotaxis protein
MAGARILIVEDDELNQRLVRAVLARSADPVLRGACVVQAGSVAEARAALALAAVDVVLLDMNLPDGNGLSLAAEVRRGGGGGGRPGGC